MQTAAARSRLGRVLAGAALVISLVAGLIGLDWGLPYAWHPDEKVEIAVDMLKRGSADPRYFTNPTFQIYLVTGAVWAAQHLVPGTPQFAMPAIVPLTDPAHPNRATQFAVHRAGRLVSVLGVMLAVGLLYVTTAARLGEVAGGLAALGLSCVAGVINVAHFATPEGTLLALSAACFASALRLQERPIVSRAATAGLLVGLAMSTKYTALLLAAATIWAMWTLRGTVAWRRLIWLAAAALAGFCVGVIIGTPYALLDFPRYWRDGIVFSWGGGVPGDSFLAERRSWVVYVAHLANAMGWPLFLSSLGGMMVAWMGLGGPSARRTLSLHGISALSFWAVLGTTTDRFSQMRFILPIVPSLCVGFGAGAAFVLTQERRTIRAVAAVGVVAVLAYSAAYSVVGLRKFVRDPRYAAGVWLSRSLAPGVEVDYFAIESYVPYFDRPTYSLRFIDDVWRLRRNEAAFLVWRGPALAAMTGVIVDASTYYNRYLDNVDRFPQRAAFYRDLLAGVDPSGYRPVARFVIDGPWWLNPQMEFAGPEVVILAKPGQIRPEVH